MSASAATPAFPRPGSLRTVAILGALGLGALVPRAAAAGAVIPWLVAAMLFVVFLGTPLRATRLHRAHLRLLGANLLLAVVGYGAGWLLGGRTVALAAFFAGVAPTAAAAPVVVGLLGGDVRFVLAAFLLSNLAIPALLVVVLPWILGTPTAAAFLPVAASIGAVVGAPLLLATVVRRAHPPAAAWPRRLAGASFATWVIALFLITAKASLYLRTEGAAARGHLPAIALLSAALCAAGFILGHRLGRPDRAREAAQALGQKNTTFTIYLALAHASPLVALGPTFYVLWHNLWNAWNLRRGAPVAARGSSPSR